MKKGKNTTIELLRVLFTFGLVIYHGRLMADLSAVGSPLFKSGSVLTEFFFILTGWLMASKAGRMLDRPEPPNLSKATTSFLLDKVKTIIPYTTYAYIVSFIVHFIIEKYSILEAAKVFSKTFWELLMLQMAGYTNFADIALNPQLWYISSMLIALAVVFPICYKYHDFFIGYIAPVIGVLLWGWLVLKYENPVAAFKIVEAGYISNLRGLSEICLGAFGYRISLLLREKEFSAEVKWLVTVAIVALTITMIYIANRNSFIEIVSIIVLLFFILIIMVFSEQGALATRLNAIPTGFLSKFSLSLFVNHLYIRYALVELNLQFSSYLVGISIYTALSVASALICLVVLGGIKKLVGKYKDHNSTI